MVRRLFPNLFDPPPGRELRADAHAALTGAVSSIPQTMAYGLIIGSALGGDYGGIGVIAALYGSVLVGLAAVLLGGCPLLVAGPRASTMLVFAALIGQLLQSSALAGMATPQPLAFALAGTAVAGAGLLQIVFAAFRCGRLAHYVPLPVVAGFVNGSALLIILSQVWPATGMPAQKSVLLLSAHLAEVKPLTLLLAATTTGLVFALPRLVRGSGGLLWAVLLATGIYQLGAAAGLGAELGGTLPPPPADFSIGFIGDEVAAALDGEHRLELLRLMLPASMSMAILSTLDTLLATSAIDGMSMRRSHGGRQLAAEGWGNLLAGLFALAPGSSSMVRTLAALRGGMVSAAAPIGIALLTLLVTVALGPALALLSKAVMAGLLIALGIDLFDKWTLARLRGLLEHGQASPAARGDLFTVAVVVATTLLADLASAVAVGVLVALLSFVLQMAHSPILRCYRASALLPRIHGDMMRRAFIERHGRSIAIVEMEGALFFGTAAELERRVDALIDDGVAHVVLDLRRVKDVDATGARTLERVQQKLSRRGGLLAIGYVDRERRVSRHQFGGKDRRRQSPARRIWLKLFHLGTVRTIGEGHFFADADAAIARCEAHLALADGGAAESAAALRPHILRGIDTAMLRRLRPYLNRLDFAPETRVFGQGDAPDGVYFLARGRVDVVINLPGTERKLKVQSLSAGAVFGEMALLDPQPRSASIVAQRATRCYRLSTEALSRLKREDSEVAFALLTNVAALFAERLRATNNMLVEMEA